MDSSYYTGKVNAFGHKPDIYAKRRFMTIGRMFRPTREEFQAIVKTCSTYREILERFNLVVTSGNYRSLRKRIKDDNIDVSNIRGTPTNREFVRKHTNETIFCKDSKVYSETAKRRLITEKLIPYQCQKCGLGDEWQGEKLVLIMDHINGDHHDNRLENLRFLCPNCNSQTETFCGRKNRRQS